MKKLILVILILGIGFFIYTRSGSDVKTPATPPPTATSEPKALPQADAISGSTLNKAFPRSDSEFKLTFSQEKDGFSQADLSKAGAKVATLTVSDTDANPSARDKFKSSTRNIGGFPAASVGSQGTAVLVGNRYQVQARSVSPSFTEGDREAWLSKFKLDALAKVTK